MNCQMRFLFLRFVHFRRVNISTSWPTFLKIPMKGSPYFSFGQSMHATLQRFYERIQELNGLSQDSLFGLPEAPSVTSNIKVPSLEDLLKIYDAAWIPDWYRSKRQREDYYKKGKEALEAFYAQEDGQWTIPVALESWFKVKMGKYLVHGRIDRVDQLPDRRLEIIDYKTGQAKEKLTGAGQGAIVAVLYCRDRTSGISTYWKGEKVDVLLSERNLENIV